MINKHQDLQELFFTIHSLLDPKQNIHLENKFNKPRLGSQSLGPELDLVLLQLGRDTIPFFGNVDSEISFTFGWLLHLISSLINIIALSKVTNYNIAESDYTITSQ